MGFGIFKKLKDGIINAGKKIAQGAKWVNDKIVKPAMPVIKNVVNRFIPGAGDIVEAVSDGIDGNFDKAKRIAKDEIMPRFKGLTRTQQVRQPQAIPYYEDEE